MPDDNARAIGASDYWTVDRIRAFVDALDTLFRHSVCEGMETAMLTSFSSMEKPEQEEIGYRMLRLAGALELYRSILSNHLRPNLFGAAAPAVELANLLGALDPERLSTTVLAHMGWELDLSSMPLVLANAIRDEALASAEEEDSEEDDND